MDAQWSAIIINIFSVVSENVNYKTNVHWSLHTIINLPLNVKFSAHWISLSYSVKWAVVSVEELAIDFRLMLLFKHVGPSHG